MDELLGGDARGTDATPDPDVEQQLNRLLEEETRRIQSNTEDRRQLMRDESIVLGRPGPAHMAVSTVADDDDAAAADDAPAIATNDATVAANPYMVDGMTDGFDDTDEADDLDDLDDFDEPTTVA